MINSTNLHEKYGTNKPEGQVLATLIHITDAHNCPIGKSPTARTDTYHEDTQAEFNELAEAVKDFSAAGVINSGDFLHLKAQTLYHPDTINQLAARVESIPASFYTIPGNHDLPNSSYDEYNRSAYRAIMRSAPNAVELSVERYGVEVSSHKTPMLNGVVSPLKGIRVWGLPFYKEESTLLKLEELAVRMAEFASENPMVINVVALHGDFFPDSFSHPFVEPIYYSKLVMTLKHAHVFCLGHIHLSYDVHATTANGIPQVISKPWSFGRVIKDIHQSSDILENRHKPSFGLIQIVRSEAGQITINCQYGVVPHKGFEQAFIRKTVAEEVKEKNQVSQYVNTLKLQAQESDADPSLVMKENLTSVLFKGADGDPEKLRVANRTHELIESHLEKA